VDWRSFAAENGGPVNSFKNQVEQEQTEKMEKDFSGNSVPSW